MDEPNDPIRLNLRCISPRKPSAGSRLSKHRSGAPLRYCADALVVRDAIRLNFDLPSKFFNRTKLAHHLLALSSTACRGRCPGSGQTLNGVRCVTFNQFFIGASRNSSECVCSTSFTGKLVGHARCDRGMTGADQASHQAGPCPAEQLAVHYSSRISGW